MSRTHSGCDCEECGKATGFDVALWLAVAYAAYLALVFWGQA
jgi:hypothetical protein